MNPHRGLLHHQIITVASVSRSKPFYSAMFTYLGYELVDSAYGAGHEFEDWKPWKLDTPHEISIGKASSEFARVKHQRGAVGHHHHLAFCADSRSDVDRFHAEVLVPLEQQGLCTVENPPCDCPEYGEGYYATFFTDPDGLKYEFVINPNYLRKKAMRPPAPATAPAPTHPMTASPPLLRDQRKVDADHLRVLAVFHVVVAGFAVLGLGFLAMHYAFMRTVFENPGIIKTAKGGLPPEQIFTMFKWFYVFFGVFLAAGGLGNLLSGIFILRRRHRVFSLVIGGLNCLQIPFGTVLGMFTIIVLLRDSVKETYETKALSSR